MSRLEHFDRNFRERWAESSMGAIVMNSPPVRSLAAFGSWAVSSYAEFYGQKGRIDSSDPEILAHEALQRNAMMKQLELSQFLQRLKKETLINIGLICDGREGLPFALAHVACQNAKIVSIDGKAHHPRFHKRVSTYATDGQSIKFVTQDPHRANTAVALQNHFSVRELDLLYINGERTYGTVRNHWDFFTHYVRPGGLVALHGISGTYLDRGQNVPDLWNDIKQQYQHTEEFVESHADLNSAHWGGIGLVRIPSDKQ